MTRFTYKDVLKKVPELTKGAAYRRLQRYNRKEITIERLFKEKRISSDTIIGGVSIDMIVEKVKGISLEHARRRFSDYRKELLNLKEVLAPLRQNKGKSLVELSEEKQSQLKIMSEFRRLGDIDEVVRNRYAQQGK